MSRKRIDPATNDSPRISVRLSTEQIATYHALGGAEWFRRLLESSSLDKMNQADRKPHEATLEVLVATLFDCVINSNHDTAKHLAQALCDRLGEV